MLRWIVHQANSCWRSSTCTLFSFKLRPPQAHHFPVLLSLTGSILSALTPFCCVPQWISHDFLREVPWSHPQTLRYRWSKRLSARPRHGSILGFCELMQRRFSMRRMAWLWSIFIWPNFFPGEPCVWTKNQTTSWCHVDGFIDSCVLCSSFSLTVL